MILDKRRKAGAAAPASDKARKAELAPIELDLNSPAIEWYGAFEHWNTNSGDKVLIVELLRDGVPLSPDDSAFLADILDGSAKPHGVGGGPSLETQRRKWRRDRQIREYFKVAKEVLRETGNYGHGKHGDLRGDAITLLHKKLPLSESAIKKIVDTRPGPYPDAPLRRPSRRGP